MVTLATGVIAGCMIYNSFPNDKIAIPAYSISPEEIFSNNIALFDVDFFNPTGTQKFTTALGEEVEIESTASILQENVATWYKALRNIAVVALLSILVYTGIRILISSTSSEKAKYKQMIIDWVVAICLLFCMQYIMSFSNIIVDEITNLVKSTVQPEKYYPMIPYSDKVLEALQDAMGNEDLTKEDLDVQKSGDDEVFIWPTNLMGRIRFEVQQVKSGTANYAGYAICFMVLVFFTIFFIFTYLKRVLYMAFLTMISPLVALTYPIDKLNDGKAQAFDMWIKEYIFNLLIQPLHLLLFTILITSAYELTAKNVIYSLVALGFLIPAEKLMRKFFGFEKAQTPGLLAGPAGAAMTMAGLSKLMSRGGSKGNNGSGKGSGSDTKKEDKIKMKEDRDPTDAFDKNPSDENNTPRLAGGDDDNGFGGNDDDGEKTPLQQMSDADYEDNWLGADMADLQTMEANARDAYGLGEGMERSPEEMEDILRESGYSEDEIRDQMKEWYGDDYYDGNGDGNNGGNDTPPVDNLGEGSESGTGDNSGSNSGNDSGKDSFGRRYLDYMKKTQRRIGNTSRFYARGMANKLSNKITNAHPIRKGIRIAGGAALGLAAGSIGLAAGIAAGDPSKAFQYTTGAALGGYKAGSGGVDRVRSALTVDGTKEISDRYKYTEEEYKDREIKNRQRELQRDIDLRMRLEEKLGGKEEANKYMKEHIPDYTKYGIDDRDTLVAMAQLQQSGVDKDKVIGAAMISDRYIKGKDSNNLSGKAEKEFKETIERDGKRRNLEGDRLKEFTEDLMGTVNQLDDIRFK